MPLHAWSSTCVTMGTDALALYKPWLCCSNVWAVSCITAPWPRVSSRSLTVLLEINDKKRCPCQPMLGSPHYPGTVLKMLGSSGWPQVLRESSEALAGLRLAGFCPGTGPFCELLGSAAVILVVHIQLSRRRATGMQSVFKLILSVRWCFTEPPWPCATGVSSYMSSFLCK